MKNLVRAISKSGGVVCSAIDSTAIVREMEWIHQPSAVVSAALGRVLTAASLMGVQLKNEKDTLTLRISGDGPVGTLLAVSDSMGNVRGYPEHPIVELPVRESDGKLDVAAAVGREGTLTVIRDMGTGEPYVGTIPLVTSEIAEDITSYYATSEQTPCVCALGVLVNKNLSIQCAGGFLLHLLPGADPAEIDVVEANLAKIPAITTVLKEGKTPLDIIHSVMDGLAPEVLDEWEAEYKCRCNQQKTESILLSMGLQELEDMKKESDTAEVVCHFCDQVYNFGLDELIDKIGQKS